MRIPISTTLGALVAAEPALERLSTRLLPPRVSYALAKLVDAVGRETAYFHKTRQALAQEHGDTREATDEERATLGAMVVRIRPEAWAIFAAACEDLASIRVELDVAPVQLSDLGDAPIAAKDLALLGPLITDDVEAAVPAPRP
jgi:hypothetical protein